MISTISSRDVSACRGVGGSRRLRFDGSGSVWRHVTELFFDDRLRPFSLSLHQVQIEHEEIDLGGKWTADLVGALK